MKPRHAIGYVSSAIIGTTGLNALWNYATCTPTTQNLACLGPNTQLTIWLGLTATIAIASGVLVILDHELSNYYGDAQ